MTYCYDQVTRRCGPGGLAFALFIKGLFPTWEEALATVIEKWPGG